MSEFHSWKADMSESMPVTAHQYAPITRLDSEPCGQPATPEIRAAALHSALRGVDLGRYDHTVIGRLAQQPPLLAFETLRLTAIQAEQLTKTLMELVSATQDSGEQEPRFGLLVSLFRQASVEPQG